MRSCFNCRNAEKQVVLPRELRARAQYGMKPGGPAVEPKENPTNGRMDGPYDAGLGKDRGLQNPEKNGISSQETV